MTTTLLTTHLLLSPSSLHAKWKQDALQVIRDRYEKSCSLQYGFVQKIHSIEDILDQIISNHLGHVRIIVTFRASCFMPSENTVFDASVEMIFQHGLFASFQNSIKILVPSSHLQDDYQIDVAEGVLRHRRNGTKIRKGDYYPMRVLRHKFENGMFSCIAVLDEK